MKSLTLLTAVSLLLACAVKVSAADSGKAPPQASAEFERMKSLVGTWKGKADMGGGPMEFTVEYRLISGGSVLEERIFAGSPKEMVTMYHDRNGKLSLTHYCMVGNQPGMLLKSSDDKTLKFDFDATCGINSRKEMHMHSLSITFDGPDTITQNWRMFEEGKAKDEHPFTLKRVKA